MSDCLSSYDRYKSRLTSQDKEESESAGETSDDVVGSAEDADDVVSSNSSKSPSPGPIAVASQKTTTAKRNNIKNLFSGAKAEKVKKFLRRYLRVKLYLYLQKNVWL